MIATSTTTINECPATKMLLFAIARRVETATSKELEAEAGMDEHGLVHQLYRLRKRGLIDFTERRQGSVTILCRIVPTVSGRTAARNISRQFGLAYGKKEEAMLTRRNATATVAASNPVRRRTERAIVVVPAATAPESAPVQAEPVASPAPVVIQPFLSQKGSAMPKITTSKIRRVSDDQVRDIRARFLAGQRVSDIAADMGLQPSNVWQIAHGRTHKDLLPKASEAVVVSVAFVAEPVDNAVPEPEPIVVPVENVAALTDTQVRSIVSIIRLVPAERRDETTLSVVSTIAGTNVATIRAIVRVAALGA